MRLMLSCLFVIFLASGCSDDASDATSENTATSQTPAPPSNPAPIPADIDRKFNKIMDDFEKKISNDFWLKGEYETTFYMNKYDAYMKKKGFAAIPNTNDYKGNIDDVEVTVIHKTVSGEKGGWLQQFTIEVQTTTEQGTFKKERKFETKRD